MIAACAAVPGTRPGAAHLPPRYQMVSGEILEQRPRSELGELGRLLLRNEAEVLARIDGKIAPKRISFDEKPEMVLRRQFIEGMTLAEVDRTRWPAVLARFEHELSRVHGAGLVHGDLRPENLILSGDHLVAIDWEHALPIGAELAAVPFRAATPGLSDPRLIWGRGKVDAELDVYSISRMKDAC